MSEAVSLLYPLVLHSMEELPRGSFVDLVG